MNEYLESDDDERLAVVPEFEQPELQAPVVVPSPLVAQGAPVERGPFQPRVDADIEAAKADREGADRQASIMGAIESLNHAFGGSAKGLAAPVLARRNDSFADVEKKRIAEEADLQRQRQTRADALEAALARGDSPESVQAKERFAASTVGRELVQRMGPDAWARLPGNAVPGAKELLMSEVDLMKKQMSAKQGPADGALAMQAMERWYKMGGAPIEEKIAALQDMGLSEPMVKSVLLRLSEGEASRRFQGEQGDVRRDFDWNKLDQTFENRLKENDRDKAIGGLDFLDPGRPPSSTQQGNVAKVAADYSDLYNNVLKMRDVLRDKGPQAFTGPEYTDLAQNFGRALLNAKERYGLGVLQKLDEVAIRRVIEDPSSLWSFIKPADMEYNLNSALNDTANSFRQLAESNMYTVPGGDVHKYFTHGRTQVNQVPGYRPHQGNPSAVEGVKNLAQRAGRTLGDALGLGADKAPPVPTSTPVREPSGAVAPVPPKGPKTEVKRQRNKRTGQVKVIYSDGSEEIING